MQQGQRRLTVSDGCTDKNGMLKAWALQLARTGSQAAFQPPPTHLVAEQVSSVEDRDEGTHGHKGRLNLGLLGGGPIADQVRTHPHA